MKHVPRSVLAAVVLAAAGAAIAGVAAVAAPGPAPAGQVVVDNVVREAPTSAPSSTEVFVMTEPSQTTSANPPAANVPAPAPVAAAEPVQTTAPTPVEPTAPANPPTNSAGEVTAPAPPPTVRCWMDDSDPVNYPNGREVCEPA